MWKVDKVGDRYGVFVGSIEKPKLTVKNLSNAYLIKSILDSEKNDAYFGLSDCEEAMYDGGLMPVHELGELISKIEVRHTTGLDQAHLYFKVEEEAIIGQLVADMRTNCDGSKYYLKKYYSGILYYGVYDVKGKWWSSNPDSINSVFKTDVIDAVVHYTMNGSCSVSGCMAAISRYRLKELLSCCTVEGKFLHDQDLKEAAYKLESMNAF